MCADDVQFNVSLTFRIQEIDYTADLDDSSSEVYGLFQKAVIAWVSLHHIFHILQLNLQLCGKQMILWKIYCYGLSWLNNSSCPYFRLYHTHS
jgi:hypothetical protein